ncbi:antibiotic biosynthesis monooxygenase [Granulicoccus phenolivorans]|uniref:antibiotic biosynthesis monooxygenase n=1 Tax=Granulicoccus phenolivorans TaxID=266854 RepID=UPI00047D6CD0|nr:antibiotic biosynthesis monooxygenase [Granulicoccus phenolivorans]
MSRIRVVHHLEDVTDTDVVEAVQQVRTAKGCLESEAFRGITSNGRVTVVELWEDEIAFSRDWINRVRNEKRDIIADQLSTSGLPSAIYHQRTFRRERGWVDTELPQETLVTWPARGPVHIVILMSTPMPEAAIPAHTRDETNTRREHGCDWYSWNQSLEDPHHMCLTEVWSDQSIYDAHWNLRIKVAEAAAARGETQEPPAPGPRTLGSNSLEFYRHQGFRFMYDRWLPEANSDWSETISWGS